MARTTNRRGKGCRLCEPQKHAGNGDATRKPITELRRLGQERSVGRHDLGDAAEGMTLPLAMRVISILEG